MPDALIELLAAFVAEHHVEEPFRKRERQRYVQEQTFGKTPIAELRRRGGRPPGAPKA